MNLVIAGGRDFCDMRLLYDEVEAYVAENTDFKESVTVLCGMARGADMCGYDHARMQGYKVREFPANWTDHGKRAGHLRNELMAQACSHVIVFWDGKSPGTKSMIAFAKQYDKPCKIVRYENSTRGEAQVAEKVSGELKVIKKNDFGFYSVKIGDTWYGTGSKNEPAGVAKGDIVEGEYELEKGKYKTITKDGLTKAAKAPAGAAGSSGNTTSSSWQAKDDSIRYQSSRKDALAFLALPGVLDAAGLSKAKADAKVGIIESLVDKYTASFFEDVATFGAVARATGAVSEDDKAAPPNDEDDE